MPTTNWYPAGTLVSVASGVFPWVNPGNAGADDGAYAEASVAGVTTLISAPLRATNFGFTAGGTPVPAGSRILGVEVVIKCAAVGGVVRQASLRLYRNGVFSPSDKAQTAADWPDTALAFGAAQGSATSLWGFTVRDTDVRAATFGLELTVAALCPAPAGSGNLIAARVDATWMRITYDTGVAGAEMPERATMVFFGRSAAMGWAPLYREATAHTDTLDRPYGGRLVEAPTLTHETVGDTAIGSGVVQQGATLRLRNQDGKFLNHYLLGMSGWTVVIYYYDKLLETIADAFTGRVQQDALDEDGTLTLVAYDFDRALLDKQIPSVMVGPEIFPNTVSVGVPVPVPFGVATIPMPYICDGVGGNFDYLAGYGVFQIASVRKILEGGANKVPASVTVVPSTYTVSTTHYPGYTTIRFTARQTGGSGGTATLVADVIGPAETQTFPGAIAAVLSSVWGAGQVVDAASVTAAEDMLTQASAGQLVCAGALIEARSARDVLADLLRPFAGRIALNAVGAWEIHVPVAATAPVALLRMGVSMLRPGRRARTTITDVARQVLLSYRRDPIQNVYRRQVKRDYALDTPGGQVIEYESPFIDDDVTADAVVDFLGKRLFLASEAIVKIEVDLTHGAALMQDSLVLYDHARYGLVLSPWRVRTARKPLDRVEVDLVPYHPLAFGYTPSGEPPIELNAPPEVIPPGSTIIEVVKVSPGDAIVDVDRVFHVIATLVITINTTGNKLDAEGGCSIEAIGDVAVAVGLQIRDTTSGAYSTSSVAKPVGSGKKWVMNTTLKQASVVAGPHTVVMEIMGAGTSGRGYVRGIAMAAIESTP